MNLLRKLWSGAFSLPLTFWGFYLLGVYAFAVLLNELILFVIGRYHPLMVIMYYVALFAYALIATVGVWRSAAKNISSPVWMSKMWGIAARGSVIYGPVKVLWDLSKAYLLSSN
jgi:hypothetical protein